MRQSFSSRDGGTPHGGLGYRRPMSQFIGEFSRLDAGVTRQMWEVLDVNQVFFFRSNSRCVAVEHDVRVSSYRDVAERGADRLAVGS